MFTHGKSYYHVLRQSTPKHSIDPNRELIINRQEKDLMIGRATTNGKAVRQRNVRQETTMFKAGTLPLNTYRTSDYPKDKVSFSPNTVEEQPATSATHEAIEDGQVAEEAEVEEEEEYDTDSDTGYPTADNDEEDSLDDLMFLRAVTTRSGRML